VCLALLPFCRYNVDTKLENQKIMPNVTKWGNSLAIRIPKNIADRVNLRAGRSIAIEVVDNNIVITPQHQQYTLEELLEGASPQDFDGEYNWGEAVGEEIW
jgi:antitoxin MazE